MAERVGFEPTVGYPTPVFKTGTFGQLSHLSNKLFKFLCSSNGHLTTTYLYRYFTRRVLRLALRVRSAHAILFQTK